MIVALIHWRIRPEPEHVAAFMDHWRTMNRVENRTGLVAEFLSDVLPVRDFPSTTWHLDSESLGNFISYVTVGLWKDLPSFEQEVAQYFNDRAPLKSFEKYRRRRVVFDPLAWRIGKSSLPTTDSENVL